VPFWQTWEFIGSFAKCRIQRVKEETRTLPWTWPGPPDEVWEQVQASAVAFRPRFDRVPTEMWPRIHADVHAAVEKSFNGNGVAFGATVGFASGIKPL